MSNFKSQAKRKRELAKLDKRQAKDQKRALRKAERSGVDVTPSAGTVAVGLQSMPNQRPAPNAVVVPKAMTLAEAAERWRNTKIVKPKKR